MKITADSFKRSVFKMFNKIAITSIGDYIDYINYFINIWHPFIWFRGVSNSSFKLIPSIYRDDVWNYHPNNAEDIKNLFILRARGYLQNRYNLKKWEWYQIMQHHNLPTRLLDWTTGSLIALYFACRHSDGKAMPSVWLLNPERLNLLSQKKNVVFVTDELTTDLHDSNVDYYLSDKGNKLPKYPIGIQPPYVNDRMRTQKSCFTVHGKDKIGLENLYKENKDFQLVQLQISANITSEIKKDLVKAGISESTLFPDLDGLARELCFEYETWLS